MGFFVNEDEKPLVIVICPKYTSWRQDPNAGKIFLSSVEFREVLQMLQYKLILRMLLRVELLEYRRACGETQERMAEKLRISARSYTDLEHGKYCVSSITLLFFLAGLPEDRVMDVVHAFILQAREADENVYIA